MSDEKKPCGDCKWDELGINVSFCEPCDIIMRGKFNACMRDFRVRQANRLSDEEGFGAEGRPERRA